MAGGLCRAEPECLEDCLSPGGTDCVLPWSSNRASFGQSSGLLSKLLSEVYRLMRIKKANTTAYHPQTNRLVEWFKACIFTDMLAKIVEKLGAE